ncbi:hypothetical protein C0995_016495, partial [Termitomyces sp. Mi166
IKPLPTRHLTHHIKNKPLLLKQEVDLYAYDAGCKTAAQFASASTLASVLSTKRIMDSMSALYVTIQQLCALEIDHEHVVTSYVSSA